MLSLTPTKLRDFLTCPRMFKLKHLERAGEDTNSAALAFGRSMHAALEELYKSRDGDGGLSVSVDPDQLLRRHWEAGAYADRQEAEASFAKGREALRRYIDAFPASAERILGTEVFMSHVVNMRGLRIKFGCKADRVAVGADGVLDVLDYKTNASGRLPTAESLIADLPNFLYYLLARIFYPEYEAVRVSQLNVLTLARVAVEYDGAQVLVNKRRLVEQIRTFASSDFSPSLSEACAWCRVQDYCPVFNKEIDLDSI